MRSPSLFWRTLLLVLVLIVISLAAWLQSFRVFERAPRAQALAQQVVSVVNVTRAAVVYADPALRGDLLGELARNEGIRIVPREPTDRVAPLPDTPLTALVQDAVRTRLGAATQLASSVNGERGLWTSLAIDDDDYWVLIERNVLAREFGTQWIGWAVVALLLSVVGAVLITRVVNRPLAELSRTARLLGSGTRPPPLPARGPAEIRTVNQSFNRMVDDLDQLARDRALLLAGISHDLRTPLTRLRLEIEMAPVPAATRAAMADDLAQMDGIVGQFLDYARATPQHPLQTTDLAALVADAVRHARLAERDDVDLQVQCAAAVWVQARPPELQRALDNLLANAQRYGRSGDGRLRLQIEVIRAGPQARVTIADGGPGIAPADTARLLRPFERGQAARSEAAGAGLGLPIVARIVQQHGGRLLLAAAAPAGLRAVIELPLVPPPA